MLYWTLRPWRQVLDFSGRATRREYWLFYAQLLVVFIVLILLIGMFADVEGRPSPMTGILGVVIFLFYLFAFVATLSASVRRLHDQDRTGWLYLLTFIPLVGWIFFLIMMLTPGTPGENDYGFDPRDGDQLATNEIERVFS